MEVVPGVTVRQEYSDNANYAVHDKETDFRTIIIPEFKFRERTERLKILLRAGACGYYYSEYDEYDNVDQQYTGQIDYRFSERLIGDFHGNFQIDTQADREIDETGLVFDTQKRYSTRYSTGAKYIVSENTVAQVTGSYIDYRFDSDHYVDSWIATVNASFISNISRWVSAATDRTDMGYSRYDYGNTAVDNYYVTKGFSRKFSEKSQGIVDIGGRYTCYRQQIDAAEKEDGYWGWIGRLSYNRTWDFMTAQVNLSRTVEGSSNRMNASIRSALSGEWTVQLAETMSCRANASYYRNEIENRADDLSASDEETTWRASWAWVYGFTKDLTVQLQYAYSQITDALDDRINRHVVGIQVSYHLPLWDE